MSQYKEFLNDNRDKLTPTQQRQLDGFHREGLQVNGLIRHLKGELNARPRCPALSTLKTSLKLRLPSAIILSAPARLWLLCLAPLKLSATIAKRPLQ
jgi:hypothetical protein